MTEPGEPQVAVRRLAPDDWEAYRRIRLEMLRDAPDAFLTTHAEAAGLDEAGWRARLGGATTWLAEVGGEPAGSVTLWGGPPDGPPDEAHLVAMYVAPSARRRGVGERLVRAALDEADRRGLARVHLEVTSPNDGARRLYERCGFVATGRTQPHPRRPELHEQAMVRVPRPDAAAGPEVTGPGPSCTMGRMSDVMVRALGEADWEEFRGIRLQALTESPEAFAAKLSEEQGFDEDFWRLRLRRSTRFVAESTERLLGMVCLGRAHDDDGEVPGVGEIFGLWVRPEARGSGVATRLLKAGAERARADGLSHVTFWVGTDNGKAVAFASGMGFRPTDFRRPMRLPDGTELGDTEIAMVLPLVDDRAAPTRL